MATPQYAMQQYSTRAGVRLPSASGPMMVGREMPAGQMPGVQMPGGQITGGPMPTQPTMAYRRPSPYGNHQQVMMQRKSQYGPGMTVNPVSSDTVFDTTVGVTVQVPCWHTS